MRTRCPSCNTTFRITPDQLRSRAGKVRCGLCQAVFNALESLVEEQQPIPPSAPVAPPANPTLWPAAPAAPLTKPTTPPPPAHAASPSPPVVAPAKPSTPPPAPVAPPAKPAVAVPTPTVPPSPPVAAPTKPSAPPAPPPVAQAASPVPPPSALAALPPKPAASSPVPPAPPEAPEPAIVPPPPEKPPKRAEPAPPPPAAKPPAESKPKNFPEIFVPEDLDDELNPLTLSPFTVEEMPEWPQQAGLEIVETPEESTRAAREARLVAAREVAEAPGYDRWAADALSEDSPFEGAEPERRRLTWPFALGIVVLALIFLGQFAYYFRTEVTLRMPDTQSIFKALGIEVPLSHKADLISIEASDLQADNAHGQLALQVTLRNRATYAQAWPALELTLTDTGEAVVARRVLYAADYLSKGIDPNAFAANSEIPIRLWIEAKELTAAGYRLYVFYP